MIPTIRRRAARLVGKVAVSPLICRNPGVDHPSTQPPKCLWKKWKPLSEILLLIPARPPPLLPLLQTALLNICSWIPFPHPVQHRVQAPPVLRQGQWPPLHPPNSLTSKVPTYYFGLSPALHVCPGHHSMSDHPLGSSTPTRASAGFSICTSCPSRTVARTTSFQVSLPYLSTPTSIRWVTSLAGMGTTGLSALDTGMAPPCIPPPRTDKLKTPARPWLRAGLGPVLRRGTRRQQKECRQAIRRNVRTRTPLPVIASLSDIYTACLSLPTSLMITLCRLPTLPLNTRLLPSEPPLVPLRPFQGRQSRLTTLSYSCIPSIPPYCFLFVDSIPSRPPAGSPCRSCTGPHARRCTDHPGCRFILFADSVFRFTSLRPLRTAELLHHMLPLQLAASFPLRRPRAYATLTRLTFPLTLQSLLDPYCSSPRFSISVNPRPHSHHSPGLPRSWLAQTLEFEPPSLLPL